MVVVRRVPQLHLEVCSLVKDLDHIRSELASIEESDPKLEISVGRCPSFDLHWQMQTQCSTCRNQMFLVCCLGMGCWLGAGVEEGAPPEVEI